MKSKQMLWLAPMVFALAAGCLDTASNDDDVLPPVDEDTDPAGGGDGDGDGDGDNTGDGDNSGDGDGDGDNSGDGDGDGDGDNTGDGDGDGDGTGESNVAGTAESAQCTSFVAATDSACYGYYCGVTEATIAAELSSSRKCQIPADMLCAGTVPQKVATCARSVKSNPANIFASDEEIRQETQDCVFEDAAIKAVASEDCMGCYLDGAQCASDNCLTQCLTGDSADCDACRMENNCNQPVPGCGGLPTPF
jgi:hypothetical protein